MFVNNLVIFLVALPAVVVSSPAGLHDNDYGNGGRYGFKSCKDGGVRPGKVSCINFDSIKTNATTGIATVPKDYTGLKFDPQWSVINVTASKERLPSQNYHSAASKPNALIGSKYNPDDKEDQSPPSFGVKDGTFDLFGFYLQPMVSMPPGVSVHVVGYPADEKMELLKHSLEFSSDTDTPVYFDTHKMAGPVFWDALKKVEIFGTYGDNIDWEFFVDDIWIRWGSERESTFTSQNNEEL
ncbi:hypothetical protein DFP73DRAFT_558927, partial [Morchella snyderi]